MFPGCWVAWVATRIRGFAVAAAGVLEGVFAEGDKQDGLGFGPQRDEAEEGVRLEPASFGVRFRKEAIALIELARGVVQLHDLGDVYAALHCD